MKERVTILRPGVDGELVKSEVFASGLSEPFGIAFYPLGPNPKWVYVAESNRVVRFAYKHGDLKSKAPGEIVVRALAPTLGGHVTRDVAFSNDGRRMFISVAPPPTTRKACQPRPSGRSTLGKRAKALGPPGL